VQSSADTRAYDAHDQVGNDAILHKTGHKHASLQLLTFRHTRYK